MISLWVAEIFRRNSSSESVASTRTISISHSNASDRVALKASSVASIYQPGDQDAKGYFGKGRLQDISDELRLRVDGHPWQKIDLVLIHTNATPRQLVAVSDATNVEVWDRVRLLLSLFTAHANSLEARTQVRIARLQSDRTVLRELANQTTTGERAGYGGGGVTALQAVIANVNRELTSLRKRQRKHSKAQAERRRQRARSGAVTIGIAGYTNAGKSSFFLKMSGKEVLVEDKNIPGIEESMRSYGQNRTRYAMLSRSVVGIKKSTLVLALPGSTKGALESINAIFPEVLHLFDILKGAKH